MIDFHTHILPALDDGSASAEESVKMLELLQSQGVNKIVLSPHFYAYSSDVEQFISSRDSSVKNLMAALEKSKLNVELYLGCEVLYFNELWRIEGLEKFCIKGTNYILVEMPMSEWTESIISGVGNLISKGLTPIIAHFERYLKYRGNGEKLCELINMGAFLQMNCEYINNFFTRRKALRFFKRGLVGAIGSDCHNTTNRCPNCSEAYGFLKKKLNHRQYAQFRTVQKQLLKDAERVFPQSK